MRTPKEFTENVKKGIITEEMLGACLYSVNKRAKNCRDQERAYRHSVYNTDVKYREQKEAYYEMKDEMLSILEPTAIHVEASYYKTRIYDYEDGYWDIYDFGEYIRESGYYDSERGYWVNFLVYEERGDDRYYLLYQVGGYSFHHPIDEDLAKYYKELPQKNIGVLSTYGASTDNLLSVQFVRKVLELINSGNYQLVSGSDEHREESAA